MHIGLKEVIDFLEIIDPDYHVPHGFGKVISLPTEPNNVIFEPVENARVGDMVEYAKKALDIELDHDYYASDFLPDWSGCWICVWCGCCGPAWCGASETVSGQPGCRDNRGCRICVFGYGD